MTNTQIADADGVGRKDVYTKVTERIVSDLEQGIRPWMKPWSAEHAAGRITKPLRHNGTPYRGINILLLWGEAMAKGYNTPIWMTFKQALELDAHVRKGEHGSLVVYANTISKTETNSQGEDVEREIPFMKGYTVFNVEQVDGLPAHYYAQPENPPPLSERIAHAEDFITATGATSGAFQVNPQDLATIRALKGQRRSEPGYLAAADVNHDGVINARDVRLAGLTERLAEGLREAAASADRQLVVQSVTGLVTPFFTDATAVTDYAGAAACDQQAYGAFCRGLLARGVYPPPSQFEAWFPSLAHSERDIELTVEAAAEVLAELPS